MTAVNFAARAAARRMEIEGLTEALGAGLFADDGRNVFAVIDGASAPGLLDELYGLQPEFACLYRGELAPDMAEVAPYLVRLEAGAEFTDWLLAEGWGRHWGVFAASFAGLRELRNHFRSFLTVYDEAGKPMLFRFYDPRVLRVFLPTCEEPELKSVFGPVTSYLLEDEDAGAMLSFELSSGALRQSRTPLVAR